MPLFRYISDENTAQGLQPGTATLPQGGVSDTDDGQFIEDGVTIPWLSDPEVSWVEYRCHTEVFLDAGVALHRPLPQWTQSSAVDTLGTVDVAKAQEMAENVNSSINTISRANYSDVAQRMAAPLYLFRLSGWGLRVGYKIPIPSLVSVAGVTPVPAARQWAVEDTVGNYNGVPVFFAQWDLWYYVTVPPTAGVVPPANMAAHVRGDSVPPTDLQVPLTVTDPNAVAGPNTGPNFNPQR